MENLRLRSHLEVYAGFREERLFLIVSLLKETLRRWAWRAPGTCQIQTEMTQGKLVGSFRTRAKSQRCATYGRLFSLGAYKQSEVSED